MTWLRHLWARMAGRRSGADVHITVNVARGTGEADIGRQIVEAIKRFERGSGAGWRQ